MRGRYVGRRYVRGEMSEGEMGEEEICEGRWVRIIFQGMGGGICEREMVRGDM